VPALPRKEAVALKIVFFVHSLASDWNHGNAHFLRGLMRALIARGHDVIGCERVRNWSTENLLRDHGQAPLLEFARLFPDLDVRVYGERGALIEEVDALTRGADLVIMHEFNPPELVGAVGHVRLLRDDFALLFHDTHHRAASAPGELVAFNLRHYDGVLAFGRSLAELWRTEYAHPRVWTFHEAADTTVFHPLQGERSDDVVWIGNWGDEERTRELQSYLLGSARALPNLRFAAHGVRYPEHALQEFARAGVDFRGWVPNYQVPGVFSRARLTIHVPRGPYLDRLPGIPTIRPFEALACGIPLISAPWRDLEGLFRAGRDYVAVGSPEEMQGWIRRLVEHPEERERLAASGLETIRTQHTCVHRAEQLEQIWTELAQAPSLRRRARPRAVPEVAPTRSEPHHARVDSRVQGVR
jgi:spore maturation protein CgeB